MYKSKVFSNYLRKRFRKFILLYGKYFVMIALQFIM